MKKKPQQQHHGCEIEARGIIFKLQSPPASCFLLPFRRRISSKLDVEDGVAGAPPPPPESGKTRYVLNDVTVLAKPCELLAVVGPSGAGKSTLLNILAGALVPSPPSPPVLVDGEPMNRQAFMKIAGFVPQHDKLFPLLTVKETLLFSAKLRLGGSTSAAEHRRRVESLISELGLGAVADSRVGNGAGGLSGGERRRVSIGAEAVHEPRVLVLDEPTSGLDSASALQIMGMLKSMSERDGRTVVLSIHQPGHSIVKLFSSVVILSGGGSVVHHGSVDELVVLLRSVAGLRFPVHTNAVEFAIDSIEVLRRHGHPLLHRQQQAPQCRPLPATATEIDYERCTLRQLFRYVDVDGGDVDGDGGGYANSWLQETVILTHRFSKVVFRTKPLFWFRTIQMLVSGLMLGSIFFDLPDADPRGAREKVGLFAFILTYLLSGATEALPMFLLERDVLTRETSRGSYRVSSYAVANFAVFLPFLFVLAAVFSAPLYWLSGLARAPAPFAYFLLVVWLVLFTANSVAACFGAASPDFIVGNSVVSGVMGSFFLFSGYFIAEKEMPRCWVFMHYASLFKYPFEAFLVNEFSGRCLLAGGEAGVCVVSGDEVLRREGLGGGGRRWRSVAAMMCFILVYRALGYLVLRWKCNRARKGGDGGIMKLSSIL